MNKSSNICAVVVTYNRLEMLKGTIKALKAQTIPIDILIINNGSTDGTDEFLASEEGINVITQENVGGAGGFHRGMKEAVEQGYEFAWVMDDDVIPAPDCVEQLHNAYTFLTSEGEKIGFLCSKVTNQEGVSVNMPAVDGRPNETGYADWNKYIGRGYIKVFCSTFVSVFVPVGNIVRYGLPYKEFFIWGDDTEYTMRLAKENTCYQIGTSIIEHLRPGKGGQLSLAGVTDPARIKMFSNWYRNMSFLYRTRKIGYSRRQYFSYVHQSFKEALKYLRSGEVAKAQTIFKGLRQGLSFNPQVTFAEKAVK